MKTNSNQNSRIDVQEINKFGYSTRPQLNELSVYTQIIQIDKRRAQVSAKPCSNCDNCNCGALLRWMRPEAHNLWIPADHDWNIGDTVKLQLTQPMAASAVLYGLPLVGFISGIAAGNFIAIGEVSALLLGVALMIIGIGAGRFWSLRIVQSVFIERIVGAQSTDMQNNPWA